MSVAMAKEKKPKAEGDDRTNRRTAPIQVEKELARMAAVIASHDGITQSDLLSPFLRQFLRTHYERVQAEIQARLKQMTDEDRTAKK